MSPIENQNISSWEGLNVDEKSKQNTQYISDVYRAMQTRIDGYRQSIFATFFAIAAASFALDSAFLRVLVDPSLVKYQSIQQQSFVASAIAVAGIVIALLYAFAWHNIGSLNKYRRELTGVITKIDQYSGAWTVGRYAPGHTLLPVSWQGNDNSLLDVSLTKIDGTAPGWRGRSGTGLRLYALILGVAHLLGYGILSHYVFRIPLQSP